MMVLAASCSAKVKWFHVVLLLRFLDNFARHKSIPYQSDCWGFADSYFLTVCLRM